ncbi:MAG TPA: LytTR family DNA-binding domain-containing protein [Chitinophagales bacterium]|nr:LytTR family DNA-binding domain-containing protein [Chitinophagales bacterium]
MKISCIAVDDVKLNRDAMLDLITGIDFLNSLGNFVNATEALTALIELEPDVMFLDIEMPGLSGMEFLKSLNNPPVTVLTTSHKEFAAEGYEMNVFDYLVKPITRERFAKCSQRLFDFFKAKKKPLLADQLFIKANNKFVRVRLAEIQYVEAMRDFVMVYTEKGKFMTLQNLKEFSLQLPDDLFMRIHRSYVVPIGKIETIEGNTVKIQNHEIPIGESYRSNVMKSLLGKED